LVGKKGDKGQPAGTVRLGWSEVFCLPLLLPVHRKTRRRFAP
jgi:hypothetical protein